MIYKNYTNCTYPRERKGNRSEYIRLWLDFSGTIDWLTIHNTTSGSRDEWARDKNSITHNEWKQKKKNNKKRIRDIFHTILFAICFFPFLVNFLYKNFQIVIQSTTRQPIWQGTNKNNTEKNNNARFRRYRLFKHKPWIYISARVGTVTRIQFEQQ